MASSGGLTQRRKGGGSPSKLQSRGSSDSLNNAGQSKSGGRSRKTGDEENDDLDGEDARAIASGSDRPSSSSHRLGNRGGSTDDMNNGAEDSARSRLRLTLMEEVLLLGLKDKQVQFHQVSKVTPLNL